MKVKTAYLALAVLGAVIPYVFFIDFAASTGLNPGAFVAALFVNGAAGGFTADLLISSLVFWAWMFSRRGPGPAPWPFVLINLYVGLSCALPAYLWAAGEET